MTIAAKHFDPQLGIDIHTYLIPPSPIPIPLPTPHIGIVLDPFDYLPFIGGTVHVNGLKRATAGTGGLDIHIPVGGAWMPPLKIAAGPQWDDELFMGSKTVLADGDPFSKITMPVLACNIVGMIAPFRIRKPKKPHMSLLLPTTFNIAIPTNVFVGGPPTVSWTALAMAAGLSIFGKILKKTGIAGAAGAAFKKLRQKLFANMKPGFLKCKVLRAEPVDIRDGSVSVTHEDFAIPGRLPLTWTREYRSTDTHAGHCGHGWHTPADVRLELDADGSVLFHGPDMPALFPHLPHGEGIDNAVREFVDGARLIREGHELWVRTKDGLRYGFIAGPANVATLQTRVLPIERIEDLCGNHWRFERGNGQLVRIVESGVDGLQGRFLEIDSRHGRIDRMQLHDPATGLNYPLVSYRYQDGDLIAALDALDAARTFEYRQHRMVRHTDRVGLSFHYAYDAQWRVVRAWGDGGLHDYKFRYDDLLDETEITDSLGYVSIVKFDENGLPLCEIDPLDGVTVFEYDEVGRTTAVVDPMGLRMEFAYDERGNLLKLTRADGSVLTTQYDPDDRPVVIVDPLQAGWRQRWNDRGLLVEQVTPMGAVSLYEYDAAGQLSAHTNALGAKTGLHFDRHGQLRGITDPLGFVLVFQHDAMGRLTFKADANEAKTLYTYDRKGRLSRIQQADGSRVTADYDAEDQLVRYEDESGAVTRLDYVGTGQVSKRTQPDGQAVRYEYDTEQQLIAVINPRGERYGLKRDALGRIAEEVDYWGQARQYTYDAANRLMRTVDPLGQCVIYATDSLGRITAKTLPDPDRAGCVFKESFKFDARGQLVELHNPHRQVRRVFDADGRLVEEVQGSFRIANTFDAVGNRLMRETSAGNRVEFSFDLRGHLRAVAINDDAPIEIERDALGRAMLEKLGPHVERHLSYDARGRLTTQSILRDDAALFDTVYTYDAVGNLTQRDDSAQGADRYTHDPMGRVLSHTDPRGKLTHFLNDPAGDRLRTRVQETRMKQVVGGESQPELWTREGEYGGLNYVFDRAGNLVRRARSYGAHEDGGRDRDLHLRWDANHRLIESRNNGQVTRYGYDPLGRRVFKRNATQTTWFFWDGDVLLGEVRHANDASDLPQAGVAANNLVDFVAARKRRQALAQLHRGAREYVYYPSGFVPLALIDRKKVESVTVEAVVPGACASTSASGASVIFTDGDSLATDPSPSLTAPPVDEPLGRLSRERTRPSPVVSSPDQKKNFDIGFGALGSVPLGVRASLAFEESAPGTVIPDDNRLGAMRLGRGNASPASPPSRFTVTPTQAAVAEEAQSQAGAAPVEIPQFQSFAPAVAPAPSEAEYIPQTYHYHVDPNGCPTRLTSSVGEVVWSVSYTAWGSIAQTHVSELVNPIRFQGQHYDEESGLHYNRHRYYDPAIGQYVGLDPVRLLGGYSLYAYTANPQVLSDPLGLVPETTPGYTVYHLYAPGADTPYYVGITEDNRFDQRRLEHKESSRLADGARMERVETGVTYGEARGIERAHIEHYGTNTGVVGADMPGKGTNDFTGRGNRNLGFDVDSPVRPATRQKYFQAAYEAAGGKARPNKATVARCG